MDFGIHSDMYMRIQTNVSTAIWGCEVWHNQPFKHVKDNITIETTSSLTRFLCSLLVPEFQSSSCLAPGLTPYCRNVQWWYNLSTLICVENHNKCKNNLLGYGASAVETSLWWRHNLTQRQMILTNDAQSVFAQCLLVSGCSMSIAVSLVALFQRPFR